LEDGAANAVGTDAIARGDALVWQQGLLIAIGLLVCLVLIVGFPLLVTRPLHSLLHRIEQIADGDGDLRVRLDVLSKDELGKLSHAFNRFLDKLQPLIKEVGRATGEVADSAQSLAEMATANDRLISSEHVAVDQVSTAATEMGAAVHEVARNVQNAADAARQAKCSRVREPRWWEPPYTPSASWHRKWRVPPLPFRPRSRKPPILVPYWR
jgi:methyl-accepting chemotaxis protein